MYRQEAQFCENRLGRINRAELKKKNTFRRSFEGNNP